MNRKNYGMNADFRTSSIINDRKKSKHTIDSFQGGFEGADFGVADFGSESFGQATSLHGFSGSQLGEEMWNEFQRQGVSCDDQSGAPMSYSEVNYSDEQAFSETHGDEGTVVDEQTGIAIPEETHIQVKALAKSQVQKILQEQGVNENTINSILAQIDNVPASEVHQEVAAQVATNVASLKHPLMMFASQAKLNGQMGDLFSDIRDLVVSKVEVAAPAAIQQVATAAVQAAAAPIAKALTAVSQTPQAQAALQQATNSGLTQLQAAVTKKVSAIWSQYKMPVIIGASGIAALLVFAIVRKRK